MFKPIKDFITFIQKNTSINDDDDANEITDASNTMDILKTDENCDSSQEELRKVEKLNTIKNCIITTSNDMASDFEEDDIELQIKSSIMLKNPALKSSTPSPTQIKISSSYSSISSPCTSTTLTKSYTADFNQNLQKQIHHCSPEEDDELADFKNDPQQTSYEDFHSVHSELDEAQNNSADEAADELHTEEENALDDTYPNDNDSVKREIFVVIENDLNSSIASSNTDDPLAIDVTTLPLNSHETANPLDSSTTNEENDEVNELNWFERENKPTATNSTATLPSNKIEKIAIIPTSEIHQDIAGNRSNTSDTMNLSQSEEPTEEMERCDNSDSGLGTETSSLLLQTTINNSITENSSYRDCNQLTPVSVVDGSASAVSAPSATTTTTTVLPDAVTPLLRPLRSNLKRRYCDEADVETNCLPGSSNTVKEQDIYPSKKPKRSINFDTVQVYYFPRQQGFGCVPSAGGCTLGMGSQHIDFKRLTLAEHAAELRRAHRLQLQEVNPRGSSSEETDESEEDYLSEGSGSDLDADSNGFLQPVPPKQRRAILKAAGVRKIDTSEKIDCRNIRNSREVCGCTCRDFCDPETCSCSRAGIKCQVDRAMFPCGCSRDACGNTTGRVEFNPARVRTHFIHTIMRLDMENRQQQHPMTLSGASSSCAYDSSIATHNITSGANIPAHNGYYNMQTQSNYSSGYASPAYPNEHNSNYYQQHATTYANTTDGSSPNTVTSYHSLESVDSVGVPSYGEILPNYCPNDATGSLQYNTTAYHSSVNYTPTYLSYHQHNQHDEIDANSSYSTTTAQQHHNSSNNNNNNKNNGIVEHAESIKGSYNSIAEPTRQSYGITTTCNSSSTIIPTSESDFISLNTPIASSSRLSQINDMLQHNRNSTATLVAVSQHSGNSHSSTANSCPENKSNLNSSIETPPISEIQKSCFVFNSDLPMASMGSVSEKQPMPQSEPPPIATATTPPSEYDDRRLALSDYTI